MLIFQVMLKRRLIAAPSHRFHSKVSLKMKWWQHFLWDGRIILVDFLQESSFSHHWALSSCYQFFYLTTDNQHFLSCASMLSLHKETSGQLSLCNWFILILYLHRKHSREVDPWGKTLLSQRSHHLSRKQERSAQRWAHTPRAGQNEAGTRNLFFPSIAVTTKMNCF